jgi:hypothetical protein
MRLCAAKIAAMTACGLAHGDVVAINGGSSWAGWTSVGNSQTAGLWVRGSTTRTYDVYSTSFTLDSTQTVGGTRLADGAAGNGTAYTGDTQASLFSGSWKSGDRILGVGVKYSGNSRLSTIWVHVDWAGDSIQAASSVGAADGLYTANAGDLSVYSVGGANGGERHRAKQYSVFTGFTADGGSNFIAPYGTYATTASPARSFAVLANGTTGSAISAQYFINLDAVARSNGGATFGEGLLSPSTKVGFYESDANWTYSQQVFQLPTPGALALLGISLMLPIRPRSRRRA